MHLSVKHAVAGMIKSAHGCIAVTWSHALDKAMPALLLCCGQGKKAKAAARPRTYSLHEEEDGWEGIQDAQNAAATRALFQVRQCADAQG